MEKPSYCDNARGLRDLGESGGEQNLLAQSLEFVARPGTTQELRTNSVRKIREVLGAHRNFRGCMILVSEQETRLVTFLALWDEKSAAAEAERGWNLVKKILSPHVDRWLRSRNLEAFLSVDEPIAKGLWSR